jgi:hypothetical protein
MRYLTYKPAGYHGSTDSYLPQMVKKLHQLLSKTHRSILRDYLHLKNEAIHELAGILVDFAADIHCDIGIWKCYEQYNIKFFKTPLPLTGHKFVKPLNDIHLDRLRHLLWVLCRELSDVPVLSPLDEKIRDLAKAVQDFLNNKYVSLPQDSGIKAFLETSNRYGWDIKGKLLWLGSKSYLFRIFFHQYMLEQCEGESQIGYTDDFICQQCTSWSGLGVIDILAGVLYLDDDNDRKDLRSWYERHAAPFKVLSVNSKVLKILNTINDQKYLVRINMKNHPFAPGLLVIGSLTPWRGEWYWSGEQRYIENPSQSLIDDLKKNMIRRSPTIIYRYDKESEQKAVKQMAELHSSALAFYGKDLMIYPDGLSMAADWQKEFRHNWDSRAPEAIEEVVEKHGLKNNRPDISIPEDLLDSKDGLGVFLNPDSGKEIMTQFNYVVSGFRGKGIGLNQAEEEAIREFLNSNVVSPRFVRRMVKEFGDGSIKSSFRLKDTNETYWLDYLLRCHKGDFFRKHYPTISIV